MKINFPDVLGAKVASKLQLGSSVPDESPGGEKNAEADAGQVGEAHRPALRAVLNRRRMRSGARGEVKEMKLTLVKLERRIAPRYVPF